MNKFANPIYRALLALACVSMVAALMSVMLGIIGRQIDWNLPGLDAYAGYSIAAALFLALPAALFSRRHLLAYLLLIGAIMLNLLRVLPFAPVAYVAFERLPGDRVLIALASTALFVWWTLLYLRAGGAAEVPSQ